MKFPLILTSIVLLSTTSSQDLLSSAPTTDETSNDAAVSNDSTALGGFFGKGLFSSSLSHPFTIDFPNFPEFPEFPRLPEFPSFPKFPDLPDMPDFDDIFENATDSMQFINGTSYEVSQTVSKGNNGSYFYSKVIVSISPEDKQGSKEKTTAPTTTTPGSTSPPSGPPEVTRKTPVEPMGSTTPLETDTALNEIDFP
ncbi:uncharacterized protein LOC135217151 isoform X2 [Macrobrachium nipponense]|uniref:uncharacterized protein LOC135217151 isoform X2 n=1 Tax=Macrobrachium nipponense TaxID=159736 RepID=UPI0030C8B5EC